MDRTKKPELLSPAGNYEKLTYAVTYGADAVYCAMDKFGMRASAGNFGKEDFARGVEFAHKHGVKVYCTMNTMPRDPDFDELPEYIRSVSESGADAFIVSDPGVMDTVFRYAKDPVIHLSTQCSTVNSASVKFWHRAGVKRIVLARELTLEEIKTIRRGVPEEVELECFVHGAMCVSYSGRCLLSNYFTGRDANLGRCAQPCRWKYHLTEDKNGYTAEAEQDENGTYVFSSKDMRMIDHIAELAEAGIDSFKLEGRMKSAYYTAALTNAYRIAIDGYFAGEPFDERCLKETESVSHREYGTGYYFAPPSENANVVKENEYISDRPFLCTVSEYDKKTGLAKCVQRNKMRVGGKANLLSPGGFGRDIIIGEMFDSEMNPIDSTPHAGMEFYLKIDSASPMDIIRGM